MAISEGQFEVHVHDSVAFEKIYTSQFLKEGITDVRYRIMKRNEDYYYYIKEKSPSYKSEWAVVEYSESFSTLKEAKMNLGYFFIGYDVCANKSEKRQLDRHNFRKDHKIIAKNKTLKLGRMIRNTIVFIVFIVYVFIATKFVFGGLEAIGIHRDHALVDILGYPLLIAICAAPPVFYTKYLAK